MGRRKWIGFGKRDDFGNGKPVVCAGQDMRTSHAVFLKLTTATIPIFMTGLHLGATRCNGQSFNKAILWYGDIVQRKHKQEESNESDPPVHHDGSDCSGLLPDGLDSETHSVSDDRMAGAVARK